jgi:hypothetical protein
VGFFIYRLISIDQGLGGFPCSFAKFYGRFLAVIEILSEARALFL